MNDHDLLIKINTILEELKTDFNNHLSHHFRYSVMAWGIVLVALIGLIIK